MAAAVFGTLLLVVAVQEMPPRRSTEAAVGAQDKRTDEVQATAREGEPAGGQKDAAGAAGEPAEPAAGTPDEPEPGGGSEAGGSEPEDGEGNGAPAGGGGAAGAAGETTASR